MSEICSRREQQALGCFVAEFRIELLLISDGFNFAGWNRLVTRQITATCVQCSGPRTQLFMRAQGSELVVKLGVIDTAESRLIHMESELVGLIDRKGLDLGVGLVCPCGGKV